MKYYKRTERSDSTIRHSSIDIRHSGDPTIRHSSFDIRHSRRAQ
ncbi:hypothetical protein D1AOALGA4SA_10812 [Olavius algarvensis Delta 1 endosymbiont]|nr:hypothetical protein D1AOALGA4SA_10812 [Olavius algarvensis Delta 1 endosymbiont]